MDPPSPQLVERLIGSGLCRPRDLRKCRARVRRLARDIPTFETVWLDALVQTRALTAFQADVLGSETPDRLVVGPFLLVNRAGDDGRFLHYQARRKDGATPYLLSVAHGELDSPVAAEDRLSRFLQRTAVVTHPSLARLHGFEVVDGRIWVASPWTRGASLQELLVRRGRFSPRAVAAIAAQTCDALAALETVGSLHGDLRMRNVVLTPRGQAVLRIPGMRLTLFPERTIHSDVPPDDCDGVAPELMGVGRSASTATEMYAVGCLLWELLAGRPPFPHGDPLAKLAAHQTQQIPDIRDWAPETPAALAELILHLTRRTASERPQSFHEVASKLQPIARASRRELAAVVDGTTATLPVDTEVGDSRGAAKATAAALVLMAAGSVVLLNSGVRTELLSIARRSSPTAAAPQAPEVHEEDPQPPAETPQSLPAPNADGVIELSGDGPYLTGDVSVAQHLLIRGVGRGRAVIVVGEQPWRIQANRLILDNVEIRRLAPGAVDPLPLLHVDSPEFAMLKCRIDGSGAQQAGVVWKRPNGSATAEGRVFVRQTVFYSVGSAIVANEVPAQVTFDNVLHCGPRALLQLAASDGGGDSIDVVATRVTLRGASPMVDVRLISGAGCPKALSLTLEECVAELDQGALIEFSGHDAPDDWPRRLKITGESSVVRPGAAIIGLRMAPDRLRPLPTANVAIEGLLAADFAFAGSADGGPEESVITGFAGYGRSARPPGIDPQGLPAPLAQPYNSETADPQHAARREPSSSSASPPSKPQ